MLKPELKAELESLHSQSLAWALGCVGWQQEEGLEVLQSAYLKVIDGSAQFEGRSTLKTWFFSVIRLTAMERKRSSWLRENILRKNYDSGFFDRPQTALDDSTRSLRPQIAKAIKQLSEQQQRLVELVFFHELSLEEAAEIMKIQLGTARTHYQRAKDALAKTLSREDFL